MVRFWPRLDLPKLPDTNDVEEYEGPFSAEALAAFAGRPETAVFGLLVGFHSSPG